MATQAMLVWSADDKTKNDSISARPWTVCICRIEMEGHSTMGLKANESKNIKKRPPEYWAAQARARNQAIKEADSFVRPATKKTETDKTG